jgi:hypothetical protein
MVLGDEPDHYRPFAEVLACGDQDTTNAYADLFAAAPELLESLAIIAHDYAHMLAEKLRPQDTAAICAAIEKARGLS